MANCRTFLAYNRTTNFQSLFLPIKKFYLNYLFRFNILLNYYSSTNFCIVLKLHEFQTYSQYHWKRPFWTRSQVQWARKSLQKVKQQTTSFHLNKAYRNKIWNKQHVWKLRSVCIAVQTAQWTFTIQFNFSRGV